MTDQTTANLVTPSEIAEMAQRTPAAVSNWRANPKLNFPEPAGGSAARPLFLEAQITAWLEARGHTIQKDRGERAIWSVFNGLRGSVPIEALTDALMALMSARFMTRTHRDIAEQWNKVAVLPFGMTIFDDYARLVAMASATERLNGLADLPRELSHNETVAFSSLVYAVNAIELDDFELIANLALKRLAGAQARSAGQYGLAESKVSTLLANLVRETSGTIYDPACGIGEVLSQIRRKSTTHTRLVGHDIDEHALLVARRRDLFGKGSTQFVRGDVLAKDPDPDLRADVVVAEPPFGMQWDSPHAVADPRWNFGLPQRSSSEFLWIQHAIYHLAPNGRGFVITGGSPTFSGSSAAKSIRTNLVRQGCVEAVVGLPGKMLPHTSIPLFLWVLRPPTDSGPTDDVLLVDGSAELGPESAVTRWLTLGLGDDPHDHPPYARVSIDDLLTSDDVVLQPHTWIQMVEVGDSDVVGEFHTALNSLSAARGDLAQIQVERLIPSTLSTPRIVSVKDLVSQGVATLLRGRPLKNDDDERLVGVGVTESQVREGLSPVPDVTLVKKLAGGGSKFPRTEPLDILFTTMNEVHAVIDFDGGRVLDSGVFALRLDPVIFESGYAAHCLAAAWNKRHQTGGTIQRADPKALEMAVIPVAEQRDLVDLLDSLASARNGAQRVLDAADSIETNLLEAVRFDIEIGNHND